MSRQAEGARKALESRGLHAVQVWFDSELATLTITSWDTWDRWRVGQEIRMATSVLAAAGYAVDDLQLGRVLNLDTNVDQVLEKFDEDTALTRELTSG